ncbi:MAG: hypothetical protein V7638_1634 [Acidobacteriota bacterium]|jgi:hypothetical protein
MQHTKEPILIELSINFPTTIDVGSHHLLTLDLDLKTPIDQWPYDEDEIELDILLDTSADFEAFPLSRTSLTVQKSGTTSGQVCYLIQAPLQQVAGRITLSVVNQNGVLLTSLSVTDIRVESDQIWKEHEVKGLLNRMSASDWKRESLSFVFDLPTQQAHQVVFEWYTEHAKYLYERGKEFFAAVNDSICKEFLSPHFEQRAALEQIRYEPVLWTDRFQFLLWAQLYARESSLSPNILMAVARLQTVLGNETIEKVLQNIWSITQLKTRDYPWSLIIEEPRFQNARIDPLQAVLCSNGKPHLYSLATDRSPLQLLNKVHAQSVTKFITATV